jgi:TRAP-type transport system periplasmic protein
MEPPAEWWRQKTGASEIVATVKEMRMKLDLRGKHSILAGILLIAVMALVAACGSQPAAAPAAPASQPAAAAPAAPAAPQFKTMTGRIGYVGEPGSMMDQDAKEFAKRVAEKSGGAITIQTFGSSQLGKQEEMNQQVQLGALELAIPSSDMVAIVEEYSIFDQPSIFANRDQVKKTVEGPVGQILAELAAQKNMVVMGTWENGFRVMTNNKGPIRTPADLAGLKIRVPPNPVRVEMFQLWGANPGPLAFSEVFSALQTGVFDGQENPYAQITSAKFYEVQKYLSETNHVYTPTYLIGSPSWLNGLDEATRAMLIETAIEVGDISRERGVKMDEEGRELVKEKGVQVNTDVDTAAFRDAALKLITDFEQKYGATGTKLMEELKKTTG